MSGSGDKRRRAPRIQGASTSITYSAPRTSAPRVSSVRTTRPTGEGFDATVLGTTAWEPEEMIGEQKSMFIYEETNQAASIPKPKMRYIRDEGEHIISEEPSGISKILFYPVFLDHEFGDRLYAEILHDTKWQQKFLSRQGETFPMPRKVAWFGPLPYSYAGITMETCEKWPFPVAIIHEQVKQKLGVEFNSVLLNLYENEHNHVAWHSDDELEMKLGSMIASVSLGAGRKFDLRKKPPPGEDYDYMQHYQINLDHGSLIVMDGKTQQDWQHRVPKEYHSRGTRINLTFRNIHSKPVPGPTNG